MAKWCFGIDLGGTTVKCALFQTDGTVEEKWEIVTRTENNGEAILPDIAATILAKIQNVSQYLDRSQLEQTLRMERGKVKKFVFSALEGEYYEIPPKVANIIATHLEDSV